MTKEDASAAASGSAASPSQQLQVQDQVLATSEGRAQSGGAVDLTDDGEGKSSEEMRWVWDGTDFVWTSRVPSSSSTFFAATTAVALPSPAAACAVRRAAGSWSSPPIFEVSGWNRSPKPPAACPPSADREGGLRLDCEPFLAAKRDVAVVPSSSLQLQKQSTSFHSKRKFAAR